MSNTTFKTPTINAEGEMEMMLETPDWIVWANGQPVCSFTGTHEDASAYGAELVPYLGCDEFVVTPYTKERANQWKNVR